MKLDFAGKERFAAGRERVWMSLNDPAILTRCIPGCRSIAELERDRFAICLDLKVASVGGSFAGDIQLSEQVAMQQCQLAVKGSGTLGHGSGVARFTLEAADCGTMLRYEGSGEIGGLVAGVGQRVLRGVSKHLIGKFLAALRRELEDPFGNA